MKRVYMLLFVALYLLNIASCTSGQSEKVDALIAIKNGDTEEYIEFPYAADLQSYDIGYVANEKSWTKWCITAHNDEQVLKRIGSAEPAPVGMPPPAIRIGGKDWENYSVSFDVFMDNAEYISFVLYDETNVFEKNEYFEGQQRFWFSFHRDGRLSFETTSGIDSYFITDEQGAELRVDNFDLGIWNNIHIKNVRDCLVLYVNNKEITELYHLNGDEHGRFALEGGVGSEFRNIRIEF